MTVIALASARGAPGVSTTAAAVAAVWPARRRVVLVEADAAGGVLAARYGLSAERGLVSLGTALRRGADAAAIWEHTQVLPGGVQAVLAAPAGEQVRATLQLCGARLPEVLGGTDADVVIDVGRLGVSPATAQLAGAADALVILARPRVEELAAVAACAAQLRSGRAEVWLAPVGDRPYPPAEVAAAVGLPVAGVVADDRRGAEALATGAAARAVRRSRLIRSARELVGWLTSPAPTSASLSQRQVLGVVG